MTENDEPEVARLSWRDQWAILVRRRWWLMGPLFVCVLGGFAVARWWPRLYRSEALILIEQPQVPAPVSAPYVTPSATADAQDWLQAMTQVILSRTLLTRLIEQFDLYPRDRAHMTIDDLVGKMQKEIKIDPVADALHPGRLTAFKISFAAGSPILAQQVTSQLTSVLIEGNRGDRIPGSGGTTDLLDKQLEEARKDLDEKEQQQRQFKMQHGGELPEQEQSNLQILNSLETQLQSTTDALTRAQRDKTYLESVRNSDLAAQQKAAQVNPQASAGGSQTAGTNDDAPLRRLRDELTELEAKYTPQHPDVLRVKQEIADLESRKQHVASPSPSQAPTLNVNADQPKSPAVIEIESRLKANAVEVAGYRKELTDLQHRITDLQSRLSLAPAREQQLSEVEGDYDKARDYYQSLLTKKSESEVAINLQKRQQGQPLRVVDAASRPDKPSEPDVTLIALASWVAGLGLGIGLMALREGAQGALISEADVSHCTHLPVLVCIPVLRSPRQRAIRRWLRALEVCAVAVLVLGSVGSGIYMYLAS